MRCTVNKWSINALGDHAIVFALAPSVDTTTVHSIAALNAFVKSKNFVGVIDLIPSYYTLTLIYDPITFLSPISNFTTQLTAFSCSIINEFDASAIQIMNKEIDIIKVPVCYEIEFALDIEKLSKEKNISTEEIVNIHCAKLYEVYSIGFLPGFTYMGIVDESIQTPRHEKPRINVNAGSVGIAGVQTGIYPTNSPGGWKIIGRTPCKVFDPNPSILAKFKVGDHIQFYPISKTDFEIMNENK
jgi:inhibitor of KinA